jgi:hypothetical protein
MKIVAFTQYHENYGAHDWDGEGLCPQYWKAKGGSTYLVKEVSYQEAADLGQTGMRKLVDEASTALTRRDDYSEEYVIGWELVEDDWQPEYGESIIRVGVA